MPDTDGIPPAQEFARLIRNRRTHLDWTQERLAQEARVSLRLVTRYEGGDVTAPEPTQLQAVCRALGINPAVGWLTLGYFTAADASQLAQAA